MGFVFFTILRTRGDTVLPIGIEETRRAIAGNSEFLLGLDDRGNPVVKFMKCGNPPPCAFHSNDGRDSEDGWYIFNPNEALNALCRLAELLDARVRGWDLKTYRSAHESYLHPDDAALREEQRLLDAQDRDKKTSPRYLVMGAVLILGLFAGKCSRKKPPETGSAAIGSLPAGPGFLQGGQGHRLSQVPAGD